MVKNPPVMQETWVRSLGGEDPLEEGMAPHSSILAWRIPWTGEPGGQQVMGSQRVGHDWALSTCTPSYPWTLCSQIQPTMDRKYLKKRNHKVPKGKT